MYQPNLSQEARCPMCGSCQIADRRNKKQTSINLIDQYYRAVENHKRCSPRPLRYLRPTNPTRSIKLALDTKQNTTR